MKVVRIILKTLGWVLLSILLLMVLLVVLIQVPSVQNWAKNKAVTYLEGKIHTKVSLEKINLRLLDGIQIKKLYLADQKKDTLLYVNDFRVDISVLQLLRSKAMISNISLDGAVAHVYRNKPDTVYNFQYIINAFASKDTTTEQDTSSSFFVDIRNLELKNIRLRFHDDVLGMEAQVKLGHLQTSLRNFDTKKMNTEIPSFVLKQTDIAFRQYKPLVILTKTDATLTVATSTTAGKDTTSIALPLKVGNISLDKIGIHYQDEIGAMLLDGTLGHLSVAPQNMDLSKMEFVMDKIQLDSTKMLFNMGKSTAVATPAQKTDTTNSHWHFGINQIGVHGLDFAYNDLTTAPIKGKGMDYSHMNFKNVVLEGEKIDLISSEYKGSITKGALQEKGGLQLKKLQTNFVYNDHGATLGKLLLQTNRTLLRDSVAVKYTSLAAIQKNPGEMYLFAHLPHTTIYMGDILAIAPMMREYMSGYENSTFKINTTIKGKVKDLQIPELEISGLNNTYVKISGSLRGLPDANKAYLDLKIDRLRSTLDDIKSLIPKSMNPNSLIHGHGPIDLQAAIKGSISNLSIPYLRFKGLSNTSIDLSARATGLPNVNKAYMDVRIKRLHISKRDIETLAPKGSIPTNKINIPNSISASGYFKGGLSAMNTNLTVRTSNGTASIKGNLNRAGIYNFNLGLNGLDLGYIAKMDTVLGKLTLTANAKGSGLDLNKFALKKLVSQFDANVVSAEVYGYNYQNFDTKGSLEHGLLNMESAILDSNIQFSMTALADLLPKYPSVQVNAQLDTLDLQKLHIVKDKMILKGKIMADFSNTDPDNLNGVLTVNNFQYKNDSLALRLDTAYLLAKNRDTAFSQMIFFADNIMKVDLHGKYKLTEMANAIQNSVMKYYNIPGYKRKKVAPQEWAVNGWIVPQKIITDFIPELKKSDSLILRGYLRSKDSVFEFGSRAKTINYTPQRLHAFNLWVATSGDSLRFGTGAQEIKSSSFHLFNTGILASVKRDTINTNITTSDSVGKPWYSLASTIIQNKDSGYILKVNPKGLMLNYIPWDVHPNNELVYNAKRGVFANNFVLSTEGQELKLQSVSDTANSPLDISFHNFQLATLANAANQSNIPIQGELNGSAQLRNILNKPIFVSDIKATTLKYGNQSIGDLALKVSNTEGEDTYTAAIDLTGNDNDMHLSGNYYQNNQGLDLKLDVRKLNLKIAQPFSTDYLDSLGGYITAAMDIKGTVDTPSINGNLKFNNAFFVPTMTGAKLTLSDETIQLDNQGLHFNNLTIRDPKNNLFKVNGDLLTKTFTDYGFNLQFDADNFMLIDVPKSTGRFFYGKLAFNTQMNLKGDMQAPIVDGNIRVNKETDFSLIMPSDDPEVQDRQGVVVFASAEQQKKYLEHLPKLLSDSLSSQSEIKGMQVNLKIVTDSAAKFAIIMDERTSDALSVSGNADLDFGIDKNGKMSLTGAYNVSKGSYQLTLELIKKKFTIQNGSTITWTGDPLSAIVDITALYNINTSAIDLLSNQLSTQQQNVYKQKIPFSVVLKMKDQLMEPKITFDITASEDEISRYNLDLIDTKLQQIRTDQSEINKQVFALLLLGRFVGENPLQSAGDNSTVGDMALQTATGILTDQLNKLAANLVQGVDLNFDLNSGTDYSSGDAVQRTDLSVGFSKRLFNDRLQVSVGSNFALQGANSNQQATNIAGDISVDYRLSKDGRYVLRAYRKNQYEVVEGQVIRTGVGFVFTFDYDRFKEAFQLAKDSRKIRKEAKKEEKAQRKQAEKEAQEVNETNEEEQE